MFALHVFACLDTVLQDINTTRKVCFWQTTKTVNAKSVEALQIKEMSEKSIKAI